MAYIIDKSEGGHEWEKLNLVTVMSKRGGYDTLKCKHCGIQGRSYNLSTVEIRGSYSSEKVFNCPNNHKAKRIQITRCNAVGKVFENLTPDSIHEVIAPPDSHRGDKGTWVMGVGEPVKVLPGEFKILN